MGTIGKRTNFETNKKIIIQCLVISTISKAGIHSLRKKVKKLRVVSEKSDWWEDQVHYFCFDYTSAWRK